MCLSRLFGQSSLLSKQDNVLQPQWCVMMCTCVTYVHTRSSPAVRLTQFVPQVDTLEFLRDLIQLRDTQLDTEVLGRVS